MSWNVISTQTEEEFFEDYVREAISSSPPGLPPFEQHIGSSTAIWHEMEPGIAHVLTEGGNTDSRRFAQFVLSEQLRGHGYKIAQFDLEWDHDDQALIKEATWDDVEAKAKRLVQSGNVQVLRNGTNNIVGQVKGDHGDYQTEIGRDDPNSASITTWQCECPWDQFAWQRTRQWKKYEGRVCAHVLATYWAAKQLPLDDEYGQGQQSLFGMPPTPAAPPQGAPAAPMPAPQGQQMGIPGIGQPQDTGVMPQFPMDPSLMPVVNPVSVPGGKPQTPLNPMQMPGGTFSSWQFDTMEHMATVPPNEDFANGSMVQLKNEDVGIAEGRSEEHGSGQYRTIPKNSIGECLGQDPTTGWVSVIFPLHDSGVMEPYHIKYWAEPGNLIQRPDLGRPGPMVRRRR